MDFIHLHVHSQYSFLDGASSLDSLLKKAKKLGMPAMALTDHNRLTGAIRFYEKAGALGINAKTALLSFLEVIIYVDNILPEVISTTGTPVLRSFLIISWHIVSKMVSTIQATAS